MRPSKPLKDAGISIRLTSKQKQTLDKIAEMMGMKTGELTGTILASFLEHHQEHGKRLIWPPEFNHFLPDSKQKQE